MRFYARLRIFMLCYAAEKLAVCGGVKKSCHKGRIRPSETDFGAIFCRLPARFGMAQIGKSPARDGR